MNNLRRVLHHIAKQQNAVGMGTRHGYVHEVMDKDGERKVRVVLGIKPDGSPWLSPWMHSEEQRGGTQEQHLVEKGQNVIVTAHGGDFRNGTFSHSAESKSFPQPPHATKVNGYTSAHGKLRTSHNKPSSSGGGGSSASLAGSTEVQTPEGFKNIQELQLGDRVISYNTNTNKPEVDMVVGIHVELTEKKMLTLSYPGGSVHCTEDHLIWSEKRRNYVYANSMFFNEALRNHLGDVVVAEAVKDLPVPPNTKVFHLTIKNNHNFFVREVGSETMLLVHNQGGGGGGSSDKHYHSVEIMDQDQNNPQHQEQSGQPQQGGSGGQSGQQKQSGGQQKDNAKSVVSNSIHESDGCTGRVGSGDEAARFASHEKGAKIRIKNNFIFVTKQGCYSSKPIQLMPKDPIPNNNQ